MKSQSVYSKVTKTAFGLQFAKAHISSFLLNDGQRSRTCIVQTGVHYNTTSSNKKAVYPQLINGLGDNQLNNRQHLTKGKQWHEKETQHTVSAAIKIVGSSTLS